MEAGFGHPDFINGGFSYQFKKINFFGKYGWLKTRSIIFNQMTGGIRYHFMKNENMFVGNQHYWIAEISYTERYKQHRISNGAIAGETSSLIRLNAGHLFELGDRINTLFYAGINYNIETAIIDSKPFSPLSFGGGFCLQYEIFESTNW